MPLNKYLQKRHFDKTSEPTGGKSNSQKLLFVVQKHAASHLHYDFRLELKGVLKSWAVPKGPSMNPEDHRLAQAVEDHPFDYKDFEGLIPKGQYGGGTVIVWDQGTYEPAEKMKGKKEQEHWLMSHYFKNHLRIKLKGKKLKGEFELVRSKERGENAWLLTKIEDKYASKSDVREKDKSVISGLTIEEMAESKDAQVWQSNRSKEPGKTKKLKREPAEAEEVSGEDFPDRISPMLATLVREVPEDDRFLYEVKWDGYRIVSYVKDGEVRLASRSNLDYTKKYPLIVEALQTLGREVILDGEVVVFNDEGMPDFDALQVYNGRRTPISYCVFDLLWLEGHNVMLLPLEQRKQLLKALLPGDGVLKYSESYDDGKELYEQMQERGLEGIIAKKKDSPYLPGDRGESWLKVPTQIRQEFVIGGWAESDKARLFRSLLFGAYNNKDEFEWIGRSGGGFKQKDMSAIMEKLKGIEVEKSPFVNKVLDTKGAVIHYVKPELVANFAFATWTKSGRIRKPATFLGFRDDKDAREVVREVPQETITDTATIEEDNPVIEKNPTKVYLNDDSNWRVLDQEEILSEHEFPVEDNKVIVTNIEKGLWEGITKGHLLMYYNSVAKYILPFLKDRPLSLHIKHSRPTAPGLYIKDMEGRQPEFAEVFSMERKHKKKGKRDVIDYLLCNNLPTLWYIINLGCIDINPWSSRTSFPLTPDFISVDLDPSDDDFNKAIVTAQAAKEVFDKYRLKAFLKTSGKTGIHMLLPCSGFDFAQARRLSEKLCEEIHSLVPDITTTEVSISKRGTKLYIDPNQNDLADTLACAYSVRPGKEPNVSTPIEWKELKNTLDPSNFNMKSIKKRLEKKGDIWLGLLDRKHQLANNKAFSLLLNQGE